MFNIFTLINFEFLRNVKVHVVQIRLNNVYLIKAHEHIPSYCVEFIVRYLPFKPNSICSVQPLFYYDKP